MMMVIMAMMEMMVMIIVMMTEPQMSLSKSTMSRSGAPDDSRVLFAVAEAFETFLSE